MNDTIIKLTPAAYEHILRMRTQNQNAIAFRLAIKKTGCSGYAYVPEMVDQKKVTDVEFEQDDLKILIDADSVKYLQDVVVDYVEDSGLGLKQKRLVFLNPIETNRCGCGESFTIE